MLFFLLSCENSLIFWIPDPYQIWLATIVCYSVGVFFTLLIMFLHVPKFWRSPIYLFFAWVVHAIGFISKNPLPKQRSLRFAPHHLSKSLFFSPLNSLGSLVGTQLTTYVWIYFWNIMYSVGLYVHSHCFDGCSFTVGFQICFHIAFRLFGNLRNSLWFEDWPFYFYKTKKKAVRALKGIALNLKITLGGISILILFSNSWTQAAFPVI